MSKARTPKRHTHKKDDHPFAVKKSKIAGKGAFATRRIRKGQRIIEYVGERITHKEADRRYDDEAMRDHHTFLFSIDETHVIDAAVRGNDARFINHACDPNCEAVDEDGHIFIEAIKNINIGQELTYDYQFEREDADDPEVEARYPCLCGSPKCRGTILAPTKKQRKAEKKKAKRAAQQAKKQAKKKSKKTKQKGKP